IGSTGKALTHLRHPGLNGLRHMAYFSALTRAAVGLLQGPGVLLVCPINSQKSGILDFGLVLTHEFFLTPPLGERVGSFVIVLLLLHRRLTLLFKILIAESWREA